MGIPILSDVNNKRLAETDNAHMRRKMEIADSGKCQLLHTPAADIKLKHILSIG